MPAERPTVAYDYDRAEGAVADEISANLHALVGDADDTSPKAAPKHPTASTTSSKFTDLQFGPNYNPSGNSKH